MSGEFRRSKLNEEIRFTEDDIEALRNEVRAVVKKVERFIDLKQAELDVPSGENKTPPIQ